METTPQSKRPNGQTLILLVIGILLALVAAAAFLSLPQAQETVQVANIGAVPAQVDFPAPNIKLSDMQGQPVAFADYKGKVVLYNAWATWCAPCKAEMPALETYYQAHKQDGFVVIAIEDGQPQAEVARFAKDYGLTFPIWPDPEYIASGTFGVNSLPTSYVIDRGGTVRLMWSGVITPALLEQYVTPLVNGN